MSWADTMRYRRWASNVRLVGWVSIPLILVLHALAESEGLESSLLAFCWSLIVMSATHLSAAILDRKAERVIGR